jgi:hypothetical protein
MAEPRSKFESAARATAAVEQRIARAREILDSLTAGDINGHGFYTEPFARQSGLGRAAREIKAAVHIITDDDSAPAGAAIYVGAVASKASTPLVHYSRLPRPKHA